MAESVFSDGQNAPLNELVAEFSDFDDGEVDPRWFGKRVPYIGWYWRDIDFENERYYIGDCGEFIGFMENNKWGYPERMLTPDEARQVSQIVAEADACKGDNDAVKAWLEKLWPLLQSFPMKIDGFWIFGSHGRVGFAANEAEADAACAALSEAGGGMEYRKVAASA